MTVAAVSKAATAPAGITKFFILDLLGEFGPPSRRFSRACDGAEEGRRSESVNYVATLRRKAKIPAGTINYLTQAL